MWMFPDRRLTVGCLSRIATLNVTAPSVNKQRAQRQCISEGTASRVIDLTRVLSSEASLGYLGRKCRRFWIFTYSEAGPRDIPLNMNMNIFRLLGDISHISSKCILIWAIHRNKSAEGRDQDIRSDTMAVIRDHDD